MLEALLLRCQFEELDRSIYLFVVESGRVSLAEGLPQLIPRCEPGRH